MITLDGNTLVLRFRQVHSYARMEIEFQRTLRIPDNLNEYPLPPGLGRLPLRHVEDFKSKLPKDWLERGGVMLPLHLSEAMWISFKRSPHDFPYPFAIKVAAGKINAISGRSWDPELNPDDQDYLVVPGQPWLDGFCVAKDQIRQFVAMPLGAGYTAEEQLTGKAEHGGLQILIYPMKSLNYDELRRSHDEWSQNRERSRACGSGRRSHNDRVRVARLEGKDADLMGLAPGGRMRQQIYADRYGFDAWDRGVSTRFFVTLVNAAQWRSITGKMSPLSPPTADDYTKAGLPWFDYNAACPTLAGAPGLSALKSVNEMSQNPIDATIGIESAADSSKIIFLGPHG